MSAQTKKFINENSDTNNNLYFIKTASQIQNDKFKNISSDYLTNNSIQSPIGSNLK